MANPVICSTSLHDVLVEEEEYNLAEGYNCVLRILIKYSVCLRHFALAAIFPLVFPRTNLTLRKDESVYNASIRET